MHEPNFPDALPLGTVIAGYEVRRVLGQGGFGIAYEGYNADLEARAAIKEFFPRELGGRDGTTFVVTRSQGQLYGQLLDKFIDEARAVRTFDHPSIVKVRHLERANNTAYMIMDFVEGRTLGSWSRSEASKLDATRIRKVFLPVIAALETVHAARKLHRDISPMNILVDAEDRPYVIDFGAAKQDWQNNPGASTLLIAHPHYAPPERMIRELGDEIGQGPVIDVYSLAAVMYETIAGDRPTPALTRQHQLAVKRTDPLRPLAEMAKVDCPKAVTDAVDRALMFDPAERPQTMAAFRTALGWDDASVPAVAEPKVTPTPAPTPKPTPLPKPLAAEPEPSSAAKPVAALPSSPTPQAAAAAPAAVPPASPPSPSGDGWDRIKSPELPPAPSTLAGWIAALPSGGGWLSPLLAVLTYAAGFLAILVLAVQLAPGSESVSPSVWCVLTGLALVVPPSLFLLRQPRTGNGLAIGWLLGSGMAALPLFIALNQGWYLAALALAVCIFGVAAYMLSLRPPAPLEAALVWLGVATTVLWGFMPLNTNTAKAQAQLGVFVIVAALVGMATIAIPVLARPPLKSPATLTYAIAFALFIALAVVASLARS